MHANRHLSVQPSCDFCKTHAACNRVPACDDNVGDDDAEDKERKGDNDGGDKDSRPPSSTIAESLVCLLDSETAIWFQMCRG